LKRTVVRAARLGLGSLLVIVGVISGFVPILQGWIFILAGLSIMAPESERARKVLDWAKKKLKREDRKAESAAQPADHDGAGQPAEHAMQPAHAARSAQHGRAAHDGGPKRPDPYDSGQPSSGEPRAQSPRDV